MPLPTLDKTWQFATRNFYTTGVQLDDLRSVLRWMKDQLKGFGLGAWTVDYSCDGVTAGVLADGVDRWDADTDLVFAAAGVAHSWIVLKQAGIAASFRLLLDLGVSTDARDINLYFSYTAGFTGGTTTARPTATDEVLIPTFTNDNWISGGTTNMLLAVAMSTDGQCTRFWQSQNAVTSGLWILDKPKNPPAGWAEPFVGFVCPPSNTTHAVSPTDLNGSNPGKLRARHGSLTLNVGVSPDGWLGVGPYTLHEHIVSDNDITAVAAPPGERFLEPASIASDTPGGRGCLGVLFDLWLHPHGTAAGVAMFGSTYPDDLGYDLIALGTLVHPWNGTQPYVVA